MYIHYTYMHFAPSVGFVYCLACYWLICSHSWFSYKKAAKLGGFYSEEGMFLGGAPRWNDWTDGSYSCVAASDNASYCQEWSTAR